MVIMLLEGAAIISIVLFLVYAAGRLIEPWNLPPGPRPLPLLGNVLDLDMKSVHLSFTKLAGKYGSIFTVYLGGQRTVIVNCFAGMREALITKKDDFAGRPSSYVHHFLFWNSSDLIFQDFGPRLILQRKLLHTALRNSQKQAEDIFKFEVTQLIKKFQGHGESSFNPKDEIQVCIANARIHVLFGERSGDKDYGHDMIDFNDTMMTALSNFSLVNMFPWLIHFPLKASKELKYLAKQRDRIFLTEYEEHLQTFTEGKHRDLTDSFIQAQEEEERENSLGATEIINKYNVVGMMVDFLLAGADTTTAGVLWILVSLLRHPEVQAKIHRELDEIIGRERTPVIDDKDKLPFLEATICETFRLWSTVSVPHKATRKSTIQGYEIPEGTTVLFNSYAVNRDNTTWENPLTFNPMRFIDEDGKCTPKYGNITTFSAGRRKCPGESLAKADLFVIMSQLLQTFEFVNPPGCSAPSLDADCKLVSKPFPFEICCKDRLSKLSRKV